MLALLLACVPWPQDPAPQPAPPPAVKLWLDRLDALARADHRHGTFGPTGDRLWFTDLRAEPGFVGIAHYVQHTDGFRDPLRVTFRAADGSDVVPKVVSETWRPTHGEVGYTLPGGGTLSEARWIDPEDVLVSRLRLVGPCDLEVRLGSAFAERPAGDLRRFVPTSLVQRADVDVERDPRLRIGTPDAPIVVEGEACSQQTGSTGPDRKRAASGGAVLGTGFGGSAGHTATWDFMATGAGATRLVVRYARLGATPARFRVDVRGAPEGELAFAPTGGWGAAEGEFATVALDLPELPAGATSLTLTALHDAANVNVDALAIAPRGEGAAAAWAELVKHAVPPLRGALSLPLGAFQIDGVPFQFVAARRTQGVVPTEPLAVSGTGALLHVLAVALAPEATLTAGGTTVRVPPRRDDPAAWHVTLRVPATGDLALTARDALVLAVTREAVATGPDERLGEVRFHGVRSDTRASLHGLERGTRLVLAAGEQRTLFATFEISGPRPPGLATARVLANSDPLEDHRLRYASWFAANAPRLVADDAALERLWTYRWFLVRHNLAWPAAGNLSGPVVYEGRHGSWYPRVITFSTPHIVAEARWLADPELWVGNVRMHQRTQGDDGVMKSLLIGWKGAHYTNWIPEAVVEACKVRGDRDLLADLLPALEREVAGNARVFDADGDGLLAPGDHYATGMEFQPSFWFHQGYDDSKPETALARVDFTSYHFGNAMAVAEADGLLGRGAERARMEALAKSARDAVLAKCWNAQDAFFYSVRASDASPARCKEIVGFYPFRFGLPPATPEYAKALAALVDPNLFWTPFPPASCAKDVPVFTPHVQQWPGPGGVVTACMWNGPTWPHSLSLVADAMARVLRSPTRGALRPEHLRHLLDRFARFHAEGGDDTKLLLREYGDGETGANWGCADYMHSTFADLMIRHAFGIVPRFDDVLEVRPLALGYAKLRCEDIPYHGHRVTIEIEGPRLRVWCDGRRLGEGSVADGLFLGAALR